MAASTLPARTLSVAIEREPRDVYEFVSNPANLPRWATAFIQSAHQEGSEWFIDTHLGTYKVRFVDRNSFGVLDHYVTVEPGFEVYSPMRVIANGGGSEVLFTLLRQPDMSDEQYAEDESMIERDLATLKSVLEASA